MPSLVEHSIFNNFIEDLKEAIIESGGDASEASCPCDYINIIKDQLTSKDNILSLDAGSGINIIKDGNKYIISSTSEATTTGDLRPPYNLDNDPDIDTIKKGTSIQEVFNKLFENILPSLPSVLSGDIIKASDNGTDQYQNPNYPETGIKSGLNPSEYYIRLFLASKQEPIYISCSALINNAGGAQYTGKDTDTILMDINNKNNTISASLNPDALPYAKQEDGSYICNQPFHFTEEIYVTKEDGDEVNVQDVLKSTAIDPPQAIENDDIDNIINQYN